MNDSSPTVLVLGARGRLGLAATRAFAQAGWQVVAQRRPGAAAPAGQLANVRWIESALDTASLRRHVAHADVVVHAMNPAYTQRAWQAEAPGLMQSAIDAALALNAVLLFPGNVYNFGTAMPPVLRSDTPQRPDTGKGVIRVALERQLADAARDHGLRSAVIRAGDFFGSGRGTLFDRLLVKDLPRGRIGLPAGLDVQTAWAYTPDLARVFVDVATRRDALQGAELFHMRGHALCGQDWVDVLTPLARQHGWLSTDAAPKVGGMPWPLIRAGGLFIAEWASLAEVRYLWSTPHGLDNSRLLALIGTEPHTPLAEAAARGAGRPRARAFECVAPPSPDFLPSTSHSRRAACNVAISFAWRVAVSWPRRA